jgi:hypothetical protein
MTAVLLALALVATVHLLLWLQVLRVNRSFVRIEPLARPPRRLPSVGVVVPARNEQAGVAAGLRSLLDQPGLAVQIVAVNDHSSDGTRAILDDLAAGEDRLGVLHDPVLEPGWLGKCNALQKGAARVRGDFVLLTDADVVHSPGCLAAAVQEMEDGRLDLLAMLPRFEFESVTESALSAAFFVAVLDFGSTRLEDPDYPEEAVGAGAFMMVRRSAWEALDGYAPVRDRVIDDIEFARAHKRAGHRVALRLGPDCARVRMYRGNREAFWGMSKNVFAVLDGRVGLVPPVLAAVALMFGAGALAMLAGGLMLEPSLVGAGAALYLLQFVSFLSLRSWIVAPPLKVLAYPWVVVVLWACLLRGVYNHLAHGAVEWRGRRLRL